MSTSGPLRATTSRDALVAAVGALVAILLCSTTARAHSPTAAVYSKYEATVAGSSVVVVFALDKRATLSLLERDAARGPLREMDVGSYAEFFSKYLFDRFTIANDGAPCAHPDRLSRFEWDERTNRVVAVSKFTCASEASQLLIRSLVTHDMPIAHELVGDLQYGGALIRSFFRGDEVEARVDLAALPSTGVVASAHPRMHNRFSFVAVPDETRRYDDLARAELAGDEVARAASDVSPGRTFAHFVAEGIRHILTGYDHVLFIVTLILTVATWRRLAITVTAFTAAHSVTLVLSTLGIVVLPSRFVEPLIAASVLVVAVEAALRPNARAHAPMAFAFGLIHGFGLSNVLRDLGLSGRGLAPALLGFNVGVELGQLAVVAPLFAGILVARRSEARYGRARAVVATSVALVAAFWIAVRVREALGG